MKARTSLRRGALGLVAVSGIAMIGAACGGVDQPAGQDALPIAAKGAATATRQAAQTCVTVQRGAFGNVADSMIASNIDGAHNPDNIAGDGNFGADTVAIAGKVGVGQREALFHFDLSNIPAGATINSATLTLQARSDSNGGPGNTLSVHAVTSAWTEAGVTWNTAPTFNPTAFASDQGGAGTHTFDVSSLAPGWFAGPNYGVLLEQDGYYYTSFSTSENATLANRPALAVCYTPSAPACAPGLTLCGSTCTDTANDDPNNCGGCGVVCPSGDTCTSSACVAYDSYGCGTGPTIPTYTGPLVHYLFQELSGTIAHDSSGNNDNGTYVGSPLLGSAGIVAGSTAMGLNGSASYMQATVQLPQSFGAITWARSTTSTWNTDGWITSARVSNGFIIHPWQGSNEVGFYITDAVQDQYTNVANAFPADITVWHQYAQSLDATTGRAVSWLDGAEVGCVNYANANLRHVAATSVAVYYGEDSPCCDPGRYGKGEIGDAQIWNRPLTDAEVLANYQLYR